MKKVNQWELYDAVCETLKTNLLDLSKAHKRQLSLRQG